MNEEKKVFKIKTKISQENSEKTFLKIMEKFEIAEFEEEDASSFINKIKFGKLYLNENNDLVYVLERPIERDKGKLERKFILQSPEQSAFSSNDIDLITVVSAYNTGNSEVIEKDSMSKIACLFIGLDPNFGSKLTTKDCITIFGFGCNLFFAG